MHKYWKGMISIIAPFAAGALGTIFTLDAIPNWYAYLNKPFFSPPNWLFGPVWTVLYLLMGIACYLIWTQKKSQKQKTALHYYSTQLMLNAVWTPVFFGLKSPLVALVIIILLILNVIIVIKHFWTISPLTGKLLIPYLAWICFAALLNAFILYLN